MPHTLFRSSIRVRGVTSATTTIQSRGGCIAYRLGTWCRDVLPVGLALVSVWRVSVGPLVYSYLQVVHQLRKRADRLPSLSSREQIGVSRCVTWLDNRYAFPPNSEGPPPNGLLVDCNNITTRFSSAPITPIGYNSHSPHSAPIRDSIPVSYFLFHFLPSSTSSSQMFPFHIASSLIGRYHHSFSSSHSSPIYFTASSLPLDFQYFTSYFSGCFPVQIKPSGQTDSCMVTRSNFKNLYWTVTQQVAHHTINGCNLRPGDLLGTGTISGPVCLVH
ncbi:hypothetical protein Gotur_022726 [Gossypium turneri]